MMPLQFSTPGRRSVYNPRRIAARQGANTAPKASPAIADGAGHGPYSLIVKWRDGRTETIASGHNPEQVREAHNRVSRNPAVIERIELHDTTGPLDSIWARSWSA